MLNLCLKFLLYLFVLQHVAVSEFLIESPNFNSNSISELFLKNLYEDYKSRQNESLTESLESEIKHRVEDFQKIHQKSVSSRSKREAREGTGVYVINGFDEAGTIPVNFPIDICLFKAGNNYYTSVLHRETLLSTSSTILKIFRANSGNYIPIFEYKTHHAESMDCINGPISGFVAVINKFGETQDTLDYSSPVFRITEDDQVDLVLRFGSPYQNSIHFWLYGDEIFLSHTYLYPEGSTRINRKSCPIYKWTGHQFILIDQIACYDSYHIEKFEIDFETFLVVANYRDDAGVSDIFSYIYKYDVNEQTFKEHQKIFTNAAHDIRHFAFEYAGVHDDFLIVENAYQTMPDGTRNYQTESVIYKYMHGHFVPFQSLVWDNVTQVLPVVGPKQEFILLVAEENLHVKMYQYDGWKFVKAPIDYSRGSLNRGIRSLRYYNQYSQQSLVVVANENHREGQTVFYYPRFKLKNDVKMYLNKFTRYADEVFEKYSQQNLVELLEILKKLPSVLDPEISVHGRLELADTLINNINTFVLHTPRITFNTDLILQIETVKAKITFLTEKLLNLQRTLAPNKTEELVSEFSKINEIPDDDNDDELTNQKSSFDDMKIDSQVKQEEPETQPQLEDVLVIDDLYVKQNLTFNFINGKPVSKLLRTLNSYELTVNVEEVITESLFVQNKIDGIDFTPSNLLILHSNQIIDGSLELHSMRCDHLYTERINEKPAQEYLNEKLEMIQATRDVETYETIKARDLFIEGFMNNIDVRIFDSFLLKPDGNQALEAPFEIETLEAKNLVLNFGSVSGKTGADFVSIKEGRFTLDKIVDFTHPIQVKDLYITDRLNHLEIDESGRLDALLKNAHDHVQEVKGHKTFENVKLTNPIGLRGKINSETLQQKNPISTIHEPLTLEGDYEIYGDVTIKSFLEGQDLTGNRNSVLKLHRHGLPLSATGSDAYFTFTQPIRVDKLQTNPSESFNPDDFIKLGTDEPQIITGHKTFEGDLNIHDGYVETNEINRIDLNALERNVLKKSGDQVVKGSIHFKTISVDNIRADYPVLGESDLSSYLTLDSEQIIPSMTITAPVAVKDLETRNIFPHESTSGTNLNHLIEDIVVNDGKQYHILGEKTFEHADIETLNFPPGARLNGIDMGAIAWDLEIFSDKYIHINETLYLQNSLKIENLIVGGSVNGIQSHEFGKAWLVNGGEEEQRFTAPVTMENVEFQGNLQIGGFLNGIDIQYMYENTLWTDRDEVVGDFECEIISAVDQITLDGTLADFKPSTDLLLKNSSQVQKIPVLTVNAGDLYASKFAPISTLNDIEYAKLLEFAFSRNPSLKMHIYGSANFQVQPIIETINDVNVDDLYENAWLKHRNAILRGQYYFNHAEFVSNIVSTGTVNDFDLEDISSSYFSLSKPQDIPCDFYFENGTIVKHLTADSATIEGQIRSLNDDGVAIDLNEFNKYAFKRDTDQEITGTWKFSELTLNDAISNIKINDLTFENDVARYDTETCYLDGPKNLNRLYIENLICESECIVQGVDLIQWMANSVTTAGDFTIQDTTVIENVTVFTDLQVFGTVNGIKFDETNLFLKNVPQKIDGEVVIRSKFPHENRIVPVYFENLNVRVINDRNVDDIFVNGAKRGQPIDSQAILTFTNPLKVGNLISKGNLLYEHDIEGKLKSLEEVGDIQNLNTQFDELKEISSILMNNQVTGFYLSEIRLKESIEGEFTRVLPVIFPDEVQRLAIFDRENPEFSVQFYKKSPSGNEIALDEDVPPMKSQTMKIVNVQKVNLLGEDYLILEGMTNINEYKQISMQYADGVINKNWVLNSSHPMKFESVSLKSGGEYLDCFVEYSEMIDTADVYCIGPHGPFLHEILEGAPISQIVTIRSQTHEDSLLVLTTDGNVVIYEPFNSKFRLKQALQVLNPSSVDATCNHNIHCYIGIATDQTENAVHHGSIEIYRSINGSDFTLIQTINIRSPKQVKFSILSTGDILMYVLTKHTVAVYQYNGAAGFKEFITNSIIPRGKEITTVGGGGDDEFVALLTETEILFIEPVLQSL